MNGIVYLLHFARPLGGRALHYIGTSTLDGLADRLDAHRHGRGARITAAANREGIAYVLVRTWRGGHVLERRLKRRANAARLCPFCHDIALAVELGRQRAARRRRRSPATARIA